MPFQRNFQGQNSIPYFLLWSYLEKTWIASLKVYYKACNKKGMLDWKYVHELCEKNEHKIWNQFIVFLSFLSMKTSCSLYISMFVSTIETDLMIIYYTKWFEDLFEIAEDAHKCWTCVFLGFLIDFFFM